MTPETMNLLANAHDEIIRLRQTVAQLEPKAHAYDTIAKFTRLMTRDEGGAYAPDVAQAIKQAIVGEQHKQESERRRRAQQSEPQSAQNRTEVLDLTQAAEAINTIG
jgi:hypothetical protein